MSGTCKTVRVKSAEHEKYGGFKEINEADFDPATHELFGVEDMPQEEAAIEDDSMTDEMREAAAAAAALMNPKKTAKK